MSALVKRTRTGFQVSDKLTFRMRQTLVQSTPRTVIWFSRSLADFGYQRSDEEVVHLLGEP